MCTDLDFCQDLSFLALQALSCTRAVSMARTVQTDVWSVDHACRELLTNLPFILGRSVCIMRYVWGYPTGKYEKGGSDCKRPLDKFL